MTTPVVAILNTSPDVINLLKDAIEHAGMLAVTGFIHEIREGKLDIESFMRVHQPRVIVYDIAPPYDRNLEFFRHLQASICLKDCRFVLTTTNARVVETMLGRNERVYEVVGKSIDLGEIVSAVREATKARPTE